MVFYPRRMKYSFNQKAYSLRLHILHNQGNVQFGSNIIFDKIIKKRTFLRNFYIKTTERTNIIESQLRTAELLFYWFGFTQTS